MFLIFNFSNFWQLELFFPPQFCEIENPHIGDGHHEDLAKFG